MRRALGRLANDLFEAGYGAAEAFVGEQLQKARERREANREAQVDVAYAQMARERCSDCGGPVWFGLRFDEFSHEYVLYWCPRPGCVNEIRKCDKRAAANREGRPI